MFLNNVFAGLSSNLFNKEEYQYSYLLLKNVDSWMCRNKI